MLDDGSINVLHAALRGLSARQQAVSDNIANVNTPYYTTKQVAFEGDLEQAMSDGTDPMDIADTVSYSSAAPGLNGNNVDLDEETVLGAKTQMQYELALRATGDRFTLLRTAAKG